MAEKSIRIGKVSSIDYENGMISVTYPDMDDSVTDEFPVLSFNDEYKMPAVDDEVLVVHLSNGMAAGVVAGKYWNQKNKPAESGKDLFRKELAKTAGEAYLRYGGSTTELKGPEVKLTGNGGSVTVSQILSLIQRVGELEKRV